MMFALLFLLSLTHASAATEACSAMDLTNTPGIEMAAIPRWSQGSTNLCYAYSAASLVDYYRLTRGDKDFSHITSPLLLALKTIENTPSNFGGGKVEYAFATAKRFGTCNIQTISDHLGTASTDLLLQTLSRSYLEAKNFPERKAKLAEDLFQFLHLSKVGLSSPQDAAEIEKNFAFSETEFIAGTLMKYCGEIKSLSTLPNVKLLFQPDATADEITGHLQNILSQRLPVGINFCANVVTDPEHRGALVNNNWRCQNNKNHSALVVGRKIVDGKCQFLIRDSGCDGYANQPLRCRDGQYWLDSQQLSQNLHGIFWLN